MKVHTLPKEHPNAVIAAMGSQPFTKQPTPAEGIDQRLAGNVLAQEVIAQCKLDGNVWLAFAWRLIKDLSTDGRAAFIKAIKAQLANMRTENEATGHDEKLTGRRIRSATTHVSELSTIANAFNSGASVEGLAAYHGVRDPENLGYVMLVEYARTFTKSAAGRKPDAFIVKMGKWLEKNKPAADGPAQDLKDYAEVVALYNKIAPEA